MNDLMEIIKNRRSVRKYEDKPVSQEDLNTLLASVRWAQSWANTQCWEVVVVRDQTVKDSLGETVLKGNPAQKSVTQAPVVLALCAKKAVSGYYKEQVTTKFGDWFLFDIGVAAQNICLCAHFLGLGGVVVGLFDHDQAAQHLKVPAGHELVCLIPLGHPAKSSAAPKRREISEFTHYDTF